MRLRFLLLALLSGLALLPARSVRASDDIPFAYRQGMIWVAVSIPGQTSPLHFLLDSGAGQTVLDLAAARRLHVELGRPQTIQGVQGHCAAYPVERLAASAAGIPAPARMLAVDLNAVSAGTGTRIDGLLGADFFRNRIVQIDFASRTIRLLSRHEIPAAQDSMPIASRNGALCIQVAVDGHKPQWLRLDTGYNGALEWVPNEPRTPHGALSAPTGEPSIALGTGLAERGSVETEVALGSERIPGVKTGLHRQEIFPGEDGLVGTGLLSRFLVTIDAEHSRLLLTRRD